MTTGTECLELYGGGAPPQILKLLDSVRDVPPDEARAQLNELRVLDPTDGVGCSVVAALLALFECG